MTITTTKPAAITTSPTGSAAPTVSHRPTRRAWIAGGAVALLALAAAGVGVVAYDGSPDATPPATSTFSTGADAAESAHGSGTSLRTGTGAPLTVSGTAAGSTGSSDAADVAHGSGTDVVTTAGQDVH
jgi:hypothetical protein